MSEWRHDPYALANPGDTFGEWVVVEPAESRHGRRWLCRCSCGTERAVAQGNLTSGKSRSCGHGKAVNLTGQRFGTLTAVEPTGERAANNRSVIWAFVCEDGNRLELAASAIRGGSGKRNCGWRCTAVQRAGHGTPQRDPDRQVVNPYDSTHKELASLYGPARGWCCVDCGEQAAQWSYSRLTPERERLITLTDSRRGVDRQVYYSTEPADYLPRCKPCHQRHDAAQAKARRAGSLPATRAGVLEGA